MSQAAADIPGGVLGRYRLESFIGEGGMGRVYRALDPTLGRPVAIKILPPGLVHHGDRLDRFILEARTASALNHPNVVTIYEIGSVDDIHFIAMELLEGETLRDRLAHGRIDLRRAVDVIGQVAEGVAAAHAAGVVHRDLKPENIILTKAGFAKILDFGLAKLRVSPTSAESATAKKTDPGAVLGSVGYMSPEQAEGEAVDHRSDIFSLGCILYEAVAGRRAFAGDSSIDTLHKILHDDPRPLADVVPDAPAELQRIVRKCLAKDRDDRYQSAKDLAIDLRDLRREIESQPRGHGAPASAGRPKRRSMMWIAAAVGLLLVVGAAAILLMRGIPKKAAAPMSVSRITASGNVIGAAISPNGEYVAYAYSDAGKHSVLVRQLSTGSTLELVSPSAIGIWGLAFSPDSQSIFYAYKMGNEPRGGLYQIPILGGPSRRLLQWIDSSVTFSPDGKRIAFFRRNSPANGHSAIIIANLDGTGEKTLISKAPPETFTDIFWGAPAWSPDGKWIASPLRRGREFTAIAVSVADGRVQPLTRDPWTFVGQVAWLRDMKGLIVVGREPEGSAMQLWSLSYSGGQRKQITNDLFDYRMATLSADGKSLLSVAADQTAAIWLSPLDGGSPRKLTGGKYDGLQGAAAAADGVVFASLDAGKWALYSIDRNGNNRRQLTVGDTQGMSPAISPDGRFIAFAMARDRDWALARMNRDGSDLRVLCPIAPFVSPPGRPIFTPDGRFVIFGSAPDGLPRYWKVSIDGGKPIPLLVLETLSISLSPDGTRVAYLSHQTLCVAPIDGGAPTQTFKDISMSNYAMTRWAPDGKALLHNAGFNDRKNVWLQPLDGSPPRQVTHFDDEYVLYFDVVPGGKELTVVRGVLSRDAVLFKNFR